MTTAGDLTQSYNTEFKIRDGLKKSSYPWGFLFLFPCSQNAA